MSSKFRFILEVPLWGMVQIGVGMWLFGGFPIRDLLGKNRIPARFCQQDATWKEIVNGFLGSRTVG